MYEILLGNQNSIKSDPISNFLKSNGYIKPYMSGTERATNNLLRIMSPPIQIEPIPGQPYWQTWIETFFPRMVNGYGQHHIDFWEYFEGLKINQSIQSRILIWSRNLGKSSTVEMSVARAIAERRRSYIWYVSSTEDQSKAHVNSIALMIKNSGMLDYYPELSMIVDNEKRKYFSNGVLLEAVWIMGKNRGAKIEERRPDLIVADDIEDSEDTQAITKKKEKRLRRDIISAGDKNTVVWFIQNQIDQYSIATSFASGEHEFLTNAHVDIVKAINNFKVHKQKPQNIPYENIRIGQETWYITGEPTSPHLSLKDAASIIHNIGLIPFRIEYQHEVDILTGNMFTQEHFRSAKHLPFCRDISFVRYWDKGATQGGGSFTCGVLMARLMYGDGADESHYYILDLVRGQWASDERDLKIKDVGIADTKEFGDKIITYIEREPGGGGKDSAKATLALLRYEKRNEIGIVISPSVDAYEDRVTTAKDKRAEPLQTQAKLGNVFVLEKEWAKCYIRRLCRLQKDNLISQVTDDLDATSGAFNKLFNDGWR